MTRQNACYEEAHLPTSRDPAAVIWCLVIYSFGVERLKPLCAQVSSITVNLGSGFGRAAFKMMRCRLSVRPYNNYGDVTCPILTGAFQGAVTHAHPESMFRGGLIRQQKSKHTCG